MIDLDQKRVHELFFYEPETGNLRWRERPRQDFASLLAYVVWNKKYPGKIAGARTWSGHRQLNIGKGSAIYVHRIIWLYVYGEWPKVIDHINGVPDDNRLSNLRSVTTKDNSRNQCRSRLNKSGETGIRQYKTRWSARICADGKVYHLGTFDTKEEAIAARKAAEQQFGFHPNHGRVAA